MAAARIIYPPMSGGDRRHFSRELHKGEQERARLVREAEAAHAAADRQLADAHRFLRQIRAAQSLGGSRKYVFFLSVKLRNLY